MSDFFFHYTDEPSTGSVLQLANSLTRKFGITDFFPSDEENLYVVNLLSSIELGITNS